METVLKWNSCNENLIQLAQVDTCVMCGIFSQWAIIGGSIKKAKAIFKEIYALPLKPKEGSDW